MQKEYTENAPVDQPLCMSVRDEGGSGIGFDVGGR